MQFNLNIEEFKLNQINFYSAVWIDFMVLSCNYLLLCVFGIHLFYMII